MSQPPQYDRQFNFQNQQSLTPADPIPADELDSELNSIKITLDATLANLAGIQRDDGQLGNDTVGVDQLKPELDNFADASIAAIAAKVAAEAAAVAAANSASSASTSAMAADTAKTDAQVSEIAAEAAQAAAEAAAVIAEAAIGDLVGTSTTSNTIGLGLKSFVTQAGKFFAPGTWMLATSDAAPATDYMHGVVTSYLGTSLLLNATTFGGSGTHADWTLRVSGTQGAPGTPGADGAAGAPGIQFAFDSSTADSDPGTGKFRFNSATLSLATALYVDNAEFNGTDVSAWLDGFDDSGSAADRGTLRIINPEVPVQLYIYKVTGSVVDGTGYRKLTIAHVSGAEGLSVGAAFSFAMFPIGATGATGAPGAPGAPGSGAVLADGDYGDVVVSGVGTILTIDSGVVTTAKMGGDVTTAGKELLDDASAGVQRTTLGVGTGDSPEFAAVNIGHATDTTLTRSGVGDLSVEGKSIYRADGTDVPVADGGSGRSTATAYAVLCGGTAATAAHQSVAAVGSTGEVLTSNGAGALPTFQAAAAGGGGAPTPPQGRLTLATGVHVMTATVSGATTVYYSVKQGRRAPIYDGSAFVMTDLGGELSQTLADATKSPAAAVANACYDYFLSDDGTKRCTRGPSWISAQTFTVTIATPAVVTQTAHGLSEGDTWVPTTTIALPTGITAGTTYFIGRNPAASTFNIATSVANAAAGTFVNTSGTQSGVHTGTNRTRVRGTGAGTTELDFSLEFPTNKNAITNGPAANRGTYVGTICTDSAGTALFWLGTSAAGGGLAFIYVWNAYNRVPLITTVNDSVDSSVYTLAVWRSAMNSTGNRANFVSGLVEDTFSALANGVAQNAAAGFCYHGIGFNATNVLSGFSATNQVPSANTFAIGEAWGTAIGVNYVQRMEYMSGGSGTWFGEIAGVLFSWLTLKWSY